MNLDFVIGAVSNIWKKMNRNKSQLIDDSQAENRRFLRINSWQIENFFKIIDDDLVKFLKCDKCYRMADNYLIAMVFVYFIRAGLEVEEYTSLNFLAALHLALAMEEDDDELPKDLEMWFATMDETPNILERRKIMFERVEYRGTISRTCCESVMRKINPNHSVWQRQRHINHSGAMSDYKRGVFSKSVRRRIICPRCV